MRKLSYLLALTVLTLATPLYAAKNGAIVPIMLWHSVRPDFKRNNPIAIKPADFEKEIAWLKQAGYHQITLVQYRDYLSGVGTLPTKPIVLAFDDGYKNWLDYAVPILKKYGYRGTMFIYTQFFDKPSKHYLDADELKRLVREGFEIQCHTYTHDHLKPYPAESPEKFHQRLEKEIVKSKAYLEKVLGIRIFALAYPFGEYCDEAIAMMKGAGYTMGLTINEGVNDDSVDPFRIHRMMLVTRDNLAAFRAKLAYGVIPIADLSIHDGAILDRLPESFTLRITDPSVLASCYRFRVTSDDGRIHHETVSKDGRMTVALNRSLKSGFRLFTIYGYQKGGKVWTNSFGFTLADYSHMPPKKKHRRSHT